jgi:sugar porter (SP) family MFS transporter
MLFSQAYSDLLFSRRDDDEVWRRLLFVLFCCPSKPQWQASSVISNSHHRQLLLSSRTTMAKPSKQDQRSYGTHQSVATSEDDVVAYNQVKDHHHDGRIRRVLDDATASNTASTNASTNTARPELPFAVYLYSFCAALNSCNLGYDIGVSTNAGPLIQQDFNLSDAQLELFLGSLNFWSIFGALLSPYITDQWGRRTTFCVAALGFCIGISIMATAGSFELLMAARAIVGIGVGIGEAIDPMYISEMAPPSHRGELVSWAEAGVSLGVVLGFLSSLFFWNFNDDPNQWRYMVGLGAFLPLVMLVLVWKVMPESPRWLLTRNEPKCTEEARAILERTYPVATNVDQVMEDIQESLEIEQAASQVVGWKSLLCFPSPAIRRMLVVGVGIAIIQQAVGIDAVMFYLVFVIRQSGITSDVGQLVALIILGTVKLLFVFVGAKLFDRVGRRIMLFISLIGAYTPELLCSCGISDVALILNVTKPPHSHSPLLSYFFRYGWFPRGR